MCAFIDRFGVIRVEHMNAARAVWDYCEESIRYLFEAQGTDSKQQGEQAEKLVAAVKAAGSQGLRGRAQYAVFNNHISADNLESITQTLHEQGRISVISIPPRSTGGREQRTLIAPEHLK